MVVQARPFRIAARQVHNAAAIPIIENVPGSGEKVTPVNPLSLPPYPVTSPLCNESSPALQIQTPSSGVFAVLLMQK